MCNLSDSLLQRSLICLWKQSKLPEYMQIPSCGSFVERWMNNWSGDCKPLQWPLLYPWVHLDKYFIFKTFLKVSSRQCMRSGDIECLSNMSKAGLDEDSTGPKKEFFTDHIVYIYWHSQARFRPPRNRILTRAGTHSCATVHWGQGAEQLKSSFCFPPASCHLGSLHPGEAPFPTSHKSLCRVVVALLGPVLQEAGQLLWPWSLGCPLEEKWLEAIT